MADTLKLMAVLAHPDDESLGSGGILAKYAAEGIETSLVTATRGERGWFGDERENPGLETLGQRREAELRAAATALGIGSVNFLNYIDGELDQAHPAEVVSKIVEHLRLVKLFLPSSLTLRENDIVELAFLMSYFRSDLSPTSIWHTSRYVFAIRERL